MEFLPDCYSCAMRQAESAARLVSDDNCGEVVFDRVLLETMSRSSEARMFAAVRDVPIINDVTMREAVEVGEPVLAYHDPA